VENKRKQRLIELGVESLADALLELAIWSDVADDLVECMISTPEENIQRFKKKLSRLKQSQRFIGWRESSGFASELKALLKDLKAGVSDPSTGIELISLFYEADKKILNNCDDSSGLIGDVFRFDAQELFMEYAALCEDKEKVASTIIKLNKNDNYGVRDALINCASECLMEAIIRSMIAKIQKLVKCEEDKYRKQHNLILIESLARQIKDAELFKQTRIASWGKISTAAFNDISRVYFESIVSWVLSNSLSVEFCLESLDMAFKIGKPEINNSDQGSQFTAEEYVNKVEIANVKVSMDGRGRVFDNIFTERLWRTLKYEEVYLKDYDSCIDAKASIDDYFTFYNNERLHSSLGYSPPAEIYFNKDRIVSNIKV